jgi:23S rRNA (pseudouridine1915-N3)-methyltransferase
MKLHIVTIGEPKLQYAKLGWDEYAKRLGRFHQLRATHLADRLAMDSPAILHAAGKAYLIAMAIEGEQMASQELSRFLDRRAHEGMELCFVIGGPDGLPPAIITDADQRWSLSQLTFPHDLAMVVLAETLYRASTISAGHPYHRG